jgi:hypothetical protein
MDAKFDQVRLMVSESIRTAEPAFLLKTAGIGLAVVILVITLAILVRKPSPPVAVSHKRRPR